MDERKGSIGKEFARYAALNVLGMLGLSCYILADTFFISKGLGANGLTALNLAIPVYSFIHGSGLMLGMGGAIKYAIFKSQGKEAETNGIFTNTIYLAAVFAVIFFVTGVLGAKAITGLFGADAEVFDMTATYLKVILMFSPAFLLNDVLICFVRNDGKPQRAMLAMLAGSLSNIVLDYLFIFPLKLGIFGAVLATGFAPLISMIFLSAHFWKKENRFKLVRVLPRLCSVKSVLMLGFSSLVTELSSGIVIIVFNMIILKLQGNVGVAAYGVIANLSLVVISVFTGIAQGIQPILSREYGKGCRLRVRQVLRYGMAAMAVLAAGIYLAAAVWAEPITAVFNSEGDRQMASIAVWGLRIYFSGILCAGFNIIAAAYFTSIEQPLPAYVISMLRGLVLIVPITFLMSAWLRITGVWLAFPITELLVTVLAAAMMKLAAKKKKGALA